MSLKKKLINSNGTSNKLLVEVNKTGSSPGSI